MVKYAKGEKRMKQISTNKINKCFALLLILIEISYFGFLIITRSKYLDSYFINDYADTGMDFFNMLALLGEQDPYCKMSNYPAMCFLILKFFYHMIPIEIIFSENATNAFFMRGYLPCLMAYIVMLLVLILVNFEMFVLIQRKQCFTNILLAFALILSGPVVFAIERGNFILIAFVCVLVYILLYDSPEKKMRYIAYVALAIAAAIKIYPALFGLLTLQKKRYKETFILLILGCLIFFMPFFAFGGISSIKNMVDGVVLAGEIQSKRGSGYNFSVTNILNIIGLIFNIQISNKTV